MPTSIHQPPPPPPQKNIKNATLAEVAHEIEEAISEAVEKNGANAAGSLRKIMYSLENKILQKHQASNPWLDQNNLNYFSHIKTKVIPTANKVPPSTVKLSSTTVLSDLTDESQGSQECSIQDLNNSASELSSLSNNKEEQSANQQLANKSNATKKSGWPKGMTVCLSLDSKMHKAHTINYAAAEWN